MGRRTFIEPASDHAVLTVAARAREGDRREMYALRGEPDMRTSLRACVRLSLWSWVLRVDEEPGAVFGIAAARTGAGLPWMVGTGLLALVPKAVLVLGREWSDRMLGLFPRLENRVLAENHRSAAWLRRCGFTLDPVARPFGATGELFHFFHKEAKDVRDSRRHD